EAAVRRTHAIFPPGCSRESLTNENPEPGQVRCVAHVVPCAYALVPSSHRALRRTEVATPSPRCEPVVPLEQVSAIDEAHLHPVDPPGSAAGMGHVGGRGR